MKLGHQDGKRTTQMQPRNPKVFKGAKVEESKTVNKLIVESLSGVGKKMSKCFMMCVFSFKYLAHPYLRFQNVKKDTWLETYSVSLSVNLCYLPTGSQRVCIILAYLDSGSKVSLFPVSCLLLLLSLFLSSFPPWNSSLYSVLSSLITPRITSLCSKLQNIM